MNAIALLKYQLTEVTDILVGDIADVSQLEWTARPVPEDNLLGFQYWHVPATQDWCVNTWIRGVSEVRERDEWRAWAGMDRASLPFGIPRETADAAVRAMRPVDVSAYAEAVLAENLAWLDTLDEADLDRVPDAASHISDHPAHRTELFQAEVADLWQERIWETLSGACIGHCRSHLDQARFYKALLRRSQGAR